MLAQGQGQSSSAKRGGLADVSSELIFLKKKKKKEGRQEDRQAGREGGRRRENGLPPDSRLPRGLQRNALGGWESLPLSLPPTLGA